MTPAWDGICPRNLILLALAEPKPYAGYRIKAPEIEVSQTIPEV
jgi:hypothetical protein